MKRGQSKRIAYSADDTWGFIAEQPSEGSLDIWFLVEMPCENYNFLVSRKEIESLHKTLSSFLEQLPK